MDPYTTKFQQTLSKIQPVVIFCKTCLSQTEHLVGSPQPLDKGRKIRKKIFLSTLLFLELTVECRITGCEIRWSTEMG